MNEADSTAKAGLAASVNAPASATARGLSRSRSITYKLAQATSPEASPAGPETAAAPVPVAPEALLAPAAAAAAAASVSQLLRAVSTERGATVTRGGPSIEDVVREELRPLLKDWLDRHLPGVVERLVRAEIERVVGRALS